MCATCPPEIVACSAVATLLEPPPTTDSMPSAMFIDLLPRKSGQWGQVSMVKQPTYPPETVAYVMVAAFSKPPPMTDPYPCAVVKEL